MKPGEAWPSRLSRGNQGCTWVQSHPDTLPGTLGSTQGLMQITGRRQKSMNSQTWHLFPNTPTYITRTSLSAGPGLACLDIPAFLGPQIIPLGATALVGLRTAPSDTPTLLRSGIAHSDTPILLGLGLNSGSLHRNIYRRWCSSPSKLGAVAEQAQSMG